MYRILFVISLWCAVFDVCFAVPVEDVQSTCLITFREQQILTIEDTTYQEYLEAIRMGEKRDLSEWDQKNMDPDIFSRFLGMIYLQEHQERESKSQEFTVTLLMWGCMVSDVAAPDFIFRNGRKRDVFHIPKNSEVYICLVTNKSTGSSYFLALERSSNNNCFGWAVIPYIINDRVYWPGPYVLDPNRSYQEQWLEYLKGVDSGPNRWTENSDKVRCVSMRIYCSNEEQENFVFPQISNEAKSDNYSKWFHFKMQGGSHMR